MMSEARLQEIARLCESATPGPWEWWTSNSFRRLSAGGDGDVLHGTIQRHDRHPDVVCSEADRAFIAAARVIIPELLAEVQRLGHYPAGTKDVAVLCFAGGRFDTISWTSAAEASALATGYSAGAGAFGFEATGYVMFHEENEMRASEDGGEVDRAMKRLTADMERRRVAQESDP